LQFSVQSVVVVAVPADAFEGYATSPAPAPEAAAILRNPRRDVVVVVGVSGKFGQIIILIRELVDVRIGSPGSS